MIQVPACNYSTINPSNDGIGVSPIRELKMQRMQRAIAFWDKSSSVRKLTEDNQDLIWEDGISLKVHAAPG